MKKFILAALFALVLLLGCLGQQTKNESKNLTTTNQTTNQTVQINVPSNVTTTTNATATGQDVQTGQINLRSKISAAMASAASKGLNSFNISIVKLELHQVDGDWVTLSSEVKQYDLIAIGQQSVLNAESSVKQMNFDKVRLTLFRHNAGLTTVTIIPGVIATKKTVPIESELSAEISSSGTLDNGTYTLFLNFDLDSGTVILDDKVTFDVRQITATLSTYDECRSKCVAVCDRDVFPDCNQSCIFDMETNCTIIARTACEAKCCIPDCSTTEKELCKVNCTAENKTACISTAPTVCREMCIASSKYIACMDSRLPSSC